MSALKKSLLSLGVQASSTTKVVMEGGNGEGGEVPLDLFSGRGPRDPQDFVIDHFEDGDPSNPMNWSRARRWYLTMAGGMLVLNATFSSSAPSGDLEDIIDGLHIKSETIAVLVLSLFVAGYCFGPLLWGPLSEQYGRRPIFIGSFLVSTVGSALSKTTAQLLVFRFLGGLFAAAPLANSGALISDIWDAETRGKALAVFTAAPFAGPALGPTVGGYLAVAGVSWRWIFWILAIFTGLCCVVIVVTMPETYKPVLLVKKAQQKRKETGDPRYCAPLERQDRNFKTQIESILLRPFKIMFLEPMLIAITVYMSFTYGCLYLLFEAYPIVFTEGHNFNPGESGLMFLPLLVGGLTGIIVYVLFLNPRYAREAARLAPRPVPPEFRLEAALFSGPLFAVSFFWFAWSSFPHISFVAPMMSGLLMGFSILGIFLSLINYTIDAYLSVAASALSSSTIIRSLFGAGFPLFASQMYVALGPRWASSLLGFVAVGLVPIPLILMRYGPKLRVNSKFCPTVPEPPKRPESNRSTV